MKITALIPAHNEAASIADTLGALLSQERVPDEIVCIADNCSDSTYEIARNFPKVTTVCTDGNKHKKSGALNFAWNKYCQDSDIVICLDADTILPSNAVGDWEQEMIKDESLGGSSSKFTMQDPGVLTRLQKAEFSKWTDTALRRGWTSVLAGTGCAIRNSVLRIIVHSDEQRDGPWSYASQVEDFELTYMVRLLGFRCHVSPTVRAYTDSMKTVKTLWRQRMKWQVGTVEDLLSIGINHLTAVDWWQQAQGLVAAFSRVLWMIIIIASVAMHNFHLQLIWMLLPILFIANDLKQANRIPHRDWKDMLLAGLLIPQELFSWMRAAWFMRAWMDVLVSKITGNRKDRWAAQYQAEGIGIDLFH